MAGRRELAQSRRSKLTLFVAAGVLALFSAQIAKADYAVLRNGQRLHVSGWENLGDTVRLDLPGGSVTIDAAELVRIEPEDVFGESAKQEVDLRVPYANEIQSAAQTYRLDPALVASVILVESNFDPHAVSRKSALGLMQLLPETAAEMAVRNVFDPAQNIDGGTHYLKQLLDRYDQNLVLALAAYNAGPKRVDLYRGIPPLAETRSYVDKVLANLRSQQNSAQRLFGGSAIDSSATIAFPANPK